MPSAKLPMTFLECPYHENSDPHILLDIRKKKELVCEILDDAQIVDEKYYASLYEPCAAPYGSSEDIYNIYYMYAITFSDVAIDAPSCHGTIPGLPIGIQPQQTGMISGAVNLHAVNYPPQFTHVSTMHCTYISLLTVSNHYRNSLILLVLEH